jgi:hypothetical protein
MLRRRYTSATHIFMFEINPLKVIVIWFIKGSQNNLIPIKYDFFSKNTNNFHTFKPKVGTWMSHVIWFECLKILTHRKLCNSYVWVRRLVEMCKVFLAFENTERLWIHIKNWTLEQIVTYFPLLLCFISFILHLSYFPFFYSHLWCHALHITILSTHINQTTYNFINLLHFPTI